MNKTGKSNEMKKTTFLWPIGILVIISIFFVSGTVLRKNRNKKSKTRLNNNKYNNYVKLFYYLLRVALEE